MSSETEISLTTVRAHNGRVLRAPHRDQDGFMSETVTSVAAALVGEPHDSAIVEFHPVPSTATASNSPSPTATTRPRRQGKSTPDVSVSCAQATPVPQVAIKRVVAPLEAQPEKSSSLSNEHAPAPGHTEQRKDPLASLVEELRGQEGLPVATVSRSFLGFAYSHVERCFSGSALVDWLVQHQFHSRPAAIETADLLRNRMFLRVVSNGVAATASFSDSPDILYRFLWDDHPTALNASPLSLKAPLSALLLSQRLRKSILSLYAEFLSDDGRFVDYSGIGASPKFELYCETARELQRVSLHTLREEEKIATYINIYNALIVHALTQTAAPKSNWQRYTFFHQTKYILGAYAYSLDDLENGLLRANRPSPASVTGRAPFGSSDPRLAAAVSLVDPRIHFALVCGAKGCPPIRTYSADGKLNEQLDLATRSFLSSGGCEIDQERHIIHLSAIFKWYRSDFGGSESATIAWISRFVDADTKTRLLRFMAMADWRIIYDPYDWTQNAKLS